MSVTFNTVPGPVIEFALTCGHGTTGHRFPDYPAVRTFLEAEHETHGGTGHLAECGDDFCAVLPVHPVGLEADPSPQMRVAGAHAGQLVRLLGYPVGEYATSGSDTAGGFLDRVLAAREAVHGDYVQARLEELQVIAEFSASRGRDVQWA